MGCGRSGAQRNTRMSPSMDDDSLAPEDLFIISDLHLGGQYAVDRGARGFRINTHAQDLIVFLTELRVRAEAGRRRTELVINGDFVDFLAEGGPDGNDWRAFIDDEEEAVARLDAIVGRDAGVFDAVASLMEAGVAVTLLLGNHDIELSLPSVRDRFCGHLRVTRSSPFRFVYDGEAYVVGDTLIEHGNRYDGFNVVDFDVLRRFRSESSRRLSATPDAFFEPPAGSRLVEEVMNPIKKDYGFIDLLKPETDAAIPLLLALEPTYAKDIDQIQRVLQLRDEARGRNPIAPARPPKPGNIRAAGREAGGPPNTLPQLLTRRIGAASANRLLAMVDEASRSERQHTEQIASGMVIRALSFARMVYFTSDWESRVDLLLDGFLQIQYGSLFDWSIESEACYRDAATELAQGGFRNVVFGHTHAAKNVDMPGGRRYMNTGAWADRLRLPEALYAGDRDRGREVLREFAVAMKEQRLARYIEFAPTFGYVRRDEGGATLPGTVHVYEPGVVRDL